MGIEHEKPIIPASDESGFMDSLSLVEQEIFNGLAAQVTDYSFKDAVADDASRPIPPEDDWGVPPRN